MSHLDFLKVVDLQKGDVDGTYKFRGEEDEEVS